MTARLRKFKRFSLYMGLLMITSIVGLVSSGKNSKNEGDNQNYSLIPPAQADITSDGGGDQCDCGCQPDGGGGSDAACDSDGDGSADNS